MDSFFLINRARNLDEFKAALQYFDFGSQNFVYADARGNIAYFTTGEMPLREDLQAGTVNGAPPWFHSQRARRQRVDSDGQSTGEPGAAVCGAAVCRNAADRQSARGLVRQRQQRSGGDHA